MECLKTNSSTLFNTFKKIYIFLRTLLTVFAIIIYDIDQKSKKLQLIYFSDHYHSSVFNETIP